MQIPGMFVNVLAILIMADVCMSAHVGIVISRDWCFSAITALDQIRKVNGLPATHLILILIFFLPFLLFHLRQFGFIESKPRDP